MKKRHKKTYTDACTFERHYRYQFELHPKYAGEHQNRKWNARIKTRVKIYTNPLHTWYTRTPNREIPNAFLFLDSY